MPDFAMCQDHKCPSRLDCYRYRAKPNPHRQNYSDYDHGQKKRCESFWPIEHYAEKNLQPIVEIGHVAIQKNA